MGLMRKALFVSTGGMSRVAGIRLNSKKERTANTLERMAGKPTTWSWLGGSRPPQPAGPLHVVTCPSCAEKVRLPYGDRQRCPACGKPMRVFPLPAKLATAAKDPVGDLERLTKLHASGALTAEEFAAAKARILGEAAS